MNEIVSDKTCFINSTLKGFFFSKNEEIFKTFDQFLISFFKSFQTTIPNLDFNVDRHFLFFNDYSRKLIKFFSKESSFDAFGNTSNVVSDIRT